MIASSEVNYSAKTLSAVLALGREHSQEEQNIIKLLEFLGISYVAVGMDRITTEKQFPGGIDASGVSLIGSANVLTDLWHDGQIAPWALDVRSIFVFGLCDDAAGRAFLRKVLGSDAAEIRLSSEKELNVSIRKELPELCGPMSGLEVRIAAGDTCRVQGPGCQGIFSVEAGDVFFRVRGNGPELYVNTSPRIVDLEEKVSRFFDVKQHLLEAVPILMYLKWAFADVAWRTNEIGGCVTLDDARLTPRYGFLCYQDAVELMDQCGFTTAIAHIPWNWRRVRRRTVNLFRRRADRLSLCSHGCDHTSGEFASDVIPTLDWRAKTAQQRMAALSSRYGLAAESIMVFPTGRFSREALRVLKWCGYLAAVNTEISPPAPLENETTIADVWSVANMRYASFPIFSRRYMWHGIENFAFDMLLGKPCLLVGHHEIFKDQARELSVFLDHLNQLNATVRWCGVGELVRYAYRFRDLRDGTREVEMFANQLLLENAQDEVRTFVVRKREEDPQFVQTISVGAHPVVFREDEGYLVWHFTLRGGESAMVSVIYQDQMDTSLRKQAIVYRLRVRARRYLAEFRDNWLSQNESLEKAAKRVRKFLKK